MLYAKKSLGQNFLRSTSALYSIIKAGKLTKEDTVLEIGPGKGALTSKLLETGATVIAIEKDKELIPFLEEKFANEIKLRQFILIEGDILDLSIGNIFDLYSKAKNQKPKAISYKLIANIPYYITGEIIRKFFEEETHPSLIVLLVQKEVAERIVARDEKESILSIACKAYSTPRYIAKVKREAFSPAPNVDSAIISFENISKDFFKSSKISEKDFFEIMKAGFAHKRKKLGGNLKAYKEKLNTDVLTSLADRRAETLTTLDWAKLIRK